MIYVLTLQTTKHQEMIDITSRINEIIDKEKVEKGTVLVYVPHTTAAITINENTDPNVRHDLLLGLNHMVPNRKEFKHFEGNSDAHLKASIIGHDQWLMIDDGHLKLGTWQGVFFCEFDGPRTRKFELKIIKSDECIEDD